MLCLPWVPAREGQRHHLEGLLCAPSGLWLGQGLVLAVQALVFRSGKGFLEHEQFPGDLQGFKTLLVPAPVEWPTRVLLQRP